MAKPDWQVFQLPELLRSIDRTKLGFQEFLRTPSLSCAIYHLPAGSRDMQTPHDEDELYLVLEGRARLRIGDQDHLVAKDSLMYVRASCDHAFFDVEQNLTVLAFFGTAVNQLAGAR